MQNDNKSVQEDNSSSNNKQPDDASIAQPVHVPLAKRLPTCGKSYNTMYVYASVLYTVLGALFFGYVMSAFNPIRDFVVNHGYSTPVETVITNLITALVPLGAGVGALSAGKLSSSMGRRKTMILVDVIAIIGTVITILPSQYALLVGRLIQGYSAGANSSVVPLVINEYAPTEIAGKLGTFNQLLITVGIIIAPLLGLAMPNGNGDSHPNSQFWRIILAIAAAPPVMRIILGILVFRSDTPRYLVSTNQDEKAQRVLAKLYRGSRAQEEFLELKEELDMESQSGKVTLREVFSARWRRRLVIGVLIAVFQQMSGVNALIFFSNDIFKIGADPQSNQPMVYTIIMSAIQIVITFIASLVVERSGRRLLLLIGFSFVTVILGAFAIVGTLAVNSPALKWFIWVYMIGFGLSVGPLPWVYMADILPDVGLGVAALANWLTVFLIGMAFPPIASAIGTAQAFFIFTGLSLLGTIFIFIWCKETKGKNQSEINAMFGGSVGNGKPVSLERVPTGLTIVA